MQLPANMEDAIREAMVNARPSRLSKRVSGIQGGSLDMAMAGGASDVAEPAEAVTGNPYASAADTVSVEDLLGKKGGEKATDAEIVA